ncbi:odorant receptor 131-2-like [Salarias fasciatus]|uniref:Odorant receptor 131-2-like n=1 Tax=Salarias fasciatus TaxID=181472 RepID=A0A672FGB3_SALFA|nr:odorant receptor 131-2-like [Salarias fasciatus]
MTSSSNASNATAVFHYRDTASSAVTKNVILLALGVVINYINSTLIHTFRKHQIFYLTPRYILFIHLVINDMIQLTTTISLFFSSYIFYSINVSVCCLIITLALFTTSNTPLNLAVMAVECFIAICFPLRHNELCTIKRTYILIGCIWALSSISIGMDIFIAVATEPLSWFYSKLLCERNVVFRHPLSTKSYEISSIIYLTGVWITIFYTYLHIIFAAKAAKAQKSHSDTNKARNTILLHSFQLSLCMLTYLHNHITHTLLSWFPKYYVHVMFVCFIFIQILPRLISPIVYGLRDKTFKQYLKKYLLCTVRGGQSMDF